MQQFEHDLASGMNASHQMNRHVDVRILNDLRNVRRQHSRRELDVPQLSQIANDGPAENDGSAGPSCHPLGLVQQDPGDPGSDGPHPDDGDMDGFS
jgi:hypothetical protein